jgi:uncharacterized membrane protein
MVRPVVVLGVVVSLSLAVRAQSPAPVAYTITRIDVPGARATGAIAINDRGDILGASSDATGRVSTWIWRDGRVRRVLEDLAVAPVGLNHVGLNNHGQVVGWYIDAAGYFHGFLRGRFGFASMDVPGATFTQAYGVNDFGHVVGYFNAYAIDGLGNRGFVADDVGVVPIAVPGATYTQAAGINNHGEIVGLYAEAAGAIVHGYRTADRGASFTTIDVPGAQVTAVTGINDHGDVVGWYLDPDLRSFVERNGRISPVTIPGGSQVVASGINNRGAIVGSYRDAGGCAAGTPCHHGFLATPRRGRHNTP